MHINLSSVELGYQNNFKNFYFIEWRDHANRKFSF